MTPQERAAWLEERRTCIGSSDAPAIMALNPPGWSDALSVYVSKLGLDEPQPESERMRWGTLLEPAIRQAYHERTNREIVEVPGITRHPEIAYIGASLDSLAFDRERGPGIVELKTTSFAVDPDDPPAHWLAQVQHQLEASKALLPKLASERGLPCKPWAEIAALVGGQELVLIPVEINARFTVAMLREEASFWARVLAQDPPPPSDPEASHRALAALYAHEDGATIELPAEALVLADSMELANEAEKKAKVEKETARNLLMAMMGAATYGTLPDGRRVSWKSQKRDAYTVAPWEGRVMRVLKGSRRNGK